MSFYKQFHIACRPSGVLCGFIDLALPKSVAACRPLASHELTYVVGFHCIKGGPTIETNNNEDIWRMVRAERRGVQIRFIRLNPRSHSAVLIGSECTELKSRLRLGPISSPRESLKSLYSFLSCEVCGTKTSDTPPSAGSHHTQHTLQMAKCLAAKFAHIVQAHCQSLA